MFKRFDDYAAALEFGRKIGAELGCYVHCVTVYVPMIGPLEAGVNYRPSHSVAFIATPSDYHKFHGLRGASYSGGGWYFGGTGRGHTDPAAIAILAESDSPALPGKGEYWYGMFAAYTTGFTREEVLEMVVEVEKNNSCVWHESAMLAKRKNPDRKIECQCGRCKPKPKTPVSETPPRPRGRGRTRLGRHSGY